MSNHTILKDFAQVGYEVDPQRKLESLFLPESVVVACKELIEEQHRMDVLRSHNLEPRHRVLLAGPPGNGKTALAEAIATELMVPLLVVDYAAMVWIYRGEMAVTQLIRHLNCVRNRRAVLFFDEFKNDKFVDEEIRQTITSLLDAGVLPSHVVVVVATSRPVDRFVLRRFQLQLYLPPPDLARIEKWCRRFELRLGAKLGVPPHVLAARLKGLSFRELEDFEADVLRRYYLAPPDADASQIVEECAKRWEQRFGSEEENARR